MSHKVRLGAVSVLSLALSACGGGGGGAVAVASTPPPPPTPSPTPTPTPTPPPLPEGPLGLTSNEPFATFAVHEDGLRGPVTGEDVQFSYSAADNSYTIKLPGYNEGKLVPTGGNGSYNDAGWVRLEGTSNSLTDGNSENLQFVAVSLAYPPSFDLKYTSFAGWADQGPLSGGQGIFVYGIPTAVGDVPISGSASYGGPIAGLMDDGNAVGGTITLNFDFGAGTLAGEMNPEWYPFWDGEPLGTYSFTNTVFSKGSTTFSGAFIPPAGASGPSSFHGRFNGPGAAEVMGDWTAPYAVGARQGTMVGVFGGRKGP